MFGPGNVSVVFMAFRPGADKSTLGRHDRQGERIIPVAVSF